MTFRWAGVVAAVAVSAVGCGGGSGGGGDLRVSVNYGGENMGLFVESTVHPEMSGFDGHDPRCSLASGSLPPGTRLHRDCSISGRPTEAGVYSFAVKVGAEDVRGNVNFSGQLTVDGPIINYTDRSFRFQPHVGEVVNDEPNTNWIAPDDEKLTWKYTLAGGALPPGLSLNSSTGFIAGSPTAAGEFEASISARLTSAYGTYELPTGTYRVTVDLASFAYTSVGGLASRPNVLLAYVSQEFVASVDTTPGATATGFSLSSGTLAPGLHFDASTGKVQGTPTSLARSSGMVEATVTTGSSQRPVKSPIEVAVHSPVRLDYNESTTIDAELGVPTAATPVIVQVSPQTLGAVQKSYSTDYCSLPPGVTFNSATGVASGVPTAKGVYDCSVTVRLTHNGVSWTTDSAFAIRVN